MATLKDFHRLGQKALAMQVIHMNEYEKYTSKNTYHCCTVHKKYL